MGPHSVVDDIWAQLKSKSTPRRAALTTPVHTTLSVTHTALDVAVSISSLESVEREIDIVKACRLGPPDVLGGTSHVQAEQTSAPRELLASELEHMLSRLITALKDGAVSVRRKALSDIRVRMCVDVCRSRGDSSPQQTLINQTNHSAHTRLF